MTNTNDDNASDDRPEGATPIATGTGTEAPADPKMHNAIDLGYVGARDEGALDAVFGVLADLVRWQDLAQFARGTTASTPEVSGVVVLSSGDDPASQRAETSGSPVAAESPQPPAPPVRRIEELASGEALEQFIDEAVAYREVLALFRKEWTTADLVAFNVRNRYRVIGHDPKKHTLIGRLVAKAKDHPRDALAREITDLFLSAIAKPMTRRKHAHVMSHVAELLASKSSGTEQSELESAIASYASGAAPRSVPLGILRDQTRRTGIAGLAAQSYLFPDDVTLLCVFGPDGADDPK